MKNLILRSVSLLCSCVPNPDPGQTPNCIGLTILCTRLCDCNDASRSCLDIFLLDMQTINYICWYVIIYLLPQISKIDKIAFSHVVKGKKEQPVEAICQSDQWSLGSPEDAVCVVGRGLCTVKYIATKFYDEEGGCTLKG